MTTSDNEQTCSYPYSDDALNSDLDMLFGALLESIQGAVDAVRRVKSPDDEDAAVKWWLLHYAVLLFGACEAGRLCLTHEMERAAWLHQQHAFEMVVRASYMQAERKYALTEFRADPIHRFRLATLGNVKPGEDFDRLKKAAEDAQVRFPELKSYKVDSIPLEQMLGPAGPERDREYAHNYRVSKQVSHGTIVSWDETLPLREDGAYHVAFVNTKEDANEILGFLVQYMLSFLKDFLAEFGLENATNKALIEAASKKLAEIDKVMDAQAAKPQ